MALEVRRIVTGHDSQGKAVVATDDRLAGTGATGRAGISRVDVWSTDKMPIDNSDGAAELQRKGLVARPTAYSDRRARRRDGLGRRPASAARQRSAPARQVTQRIATHCYAD